MAMGERPAKIRTQKQLDYYTNDERHQESMEAGSYYVQQSASQNSERALTGRWYDPAGISSKHLNGQVITEHDFNTILDGRDPELIDEKTGENKKLVRNAGKENRVMGIDITLSPPKPMTLLWVAADEKKKRLIEKIQHDAALRAVQFADECLIVTRRGAGGAVEEKAHGIYALFDHKTARMANGLVAPQLHTHCIFSGMVRAEDGTMLALQEKKLLNWRSAFENVYHAELAKGLVELGYEVEVEKGKTAFKIKGMEQFQEACEALSPRSKQIKENLGGKDRREISREEERNAVNHNRAGKVEKDRAELDWSWEGAINAVGVTTDDVRAFMEKTEALAATRTKEPFGLDSEQIAELREQIAAELHEQNSAFKEGTLYGRVAFHMQGKCAREQIDHIFAAAKGGLIPVGIDRNGERLYASETQIAMERRMVEQAKTATPQHVMDREYVEKLIASKQTPELKAQGKAMTDPQANAVREMLCGNGAARLVGISEGSAGSGKSYSANLIRQAYEEQGYTVHGIALGWKQAGVLSAEAKIESARAIAGFLQQVEQGKLKLNDKSVILIDEGGLVDAKSMARIVNAASVAGSKVVLTGDTRQLNPIGGAAMKTLVSELGSTRIGDTAQEIRRQKIEWQAQAGLDIATATARDKRAEKAVQAYRDHGHFRISKDREESMTALVASVRAHKEAHPEQSQIVIANTRADVRKLNEQLRVMKREIGEITGQDHRVMCGDGDKLKYAADFAVGETIQFRRNQKDERIYNRTLGTITRIDDLGDHPVFHVKLEDGRTTSFSPIPEDPLYNKESGALAVEPAHCQTTFSAQGATVDKAFCFDAANFDRRLAYVAMTRHRLDVEVFLDRESEAERIVTPDNWRHPSQLTEDEIFADVAKRWSNSEEKLSTYDLLKNSAYDLSKPEEVKEAEQITLLEENAKIIARAQLRHEAAREYAAFEQRETTRRQEELQLAPEAANDLIFNPTPEYSYAQLRAAREVSLYQPDLEDVGRESVAESLASMRDLSHVPMVHDLDRLEDRGIAGVLQGHEREGLEQEDQAVHALRRTGVGDHRLEGQGEEGRMTDERRPNGALSEIDFSVGTFFQPSQEHHPHLYNQLDTAPIIFAASEGNARAIFSQELAANAPFTVIVVEDENDPVLQRPDIQAAIRDPQLPIYFAGDIDRKTAEAVMRLAEEKQENYYRDLVRERGERELTL